MSLTNSIFHALQEGKKTISIGQLPPGITSDTRPFYRKITNSYQDPFPVFRLTFDQTVIIRDRMLQLLSEDGLNVDKSLETVNQKAPNELMADKLALLEQLDNERLKAPLPARRVGFEFRGEKGEVEAVVLEAMADPHTPLPLSSMADKKRLSDVPLFRIHIFSALPNARSCDLFPMSSSYYTQKKLEDRCTCDLLDDDAAHLNIGHGKKISVKEVFKFYTPEMTREIGIVNASFMADMFNFLWILKRDPLFTTKHQHVNPRMTSRRVKAGQHSPVHTLDINETELRRIKEERVLEEQAKAIAAALEKDGKYSVPGLVLVAGYPNAVSGKQVADYARCSNKEIRALATELLQRREDPASALKLAKLMNEHGNQASKDKYECDRSAVYNIRLTKQDAQL